MAWDSGGVDGDDPVQDIVDQGMTANKTDIVAVIAALKLGGRRWVEMVQAVKPAPHSIEYRDIGFETTNDTATLDTQASRTESADVESATRLLRMESQSWTP